MSDGNYVFDGDPNTGFYSSRTTTTTTATTVTYGGGKRCGQRVVNSGPTEYLLAHEGWQEQHEAYLGYCDKDRGHGGPCSVVR
jgi:hypothetical protein